MKKVIIIAAIIILFILLLSIFNVRNEGFWVCDKKGFWIKSGNPNYPTPIISCVNRIPLPKSKDDCISQRGVWKKQGPEPFETCNRKASDRGNLCRDNNECEGMCQVDLTKEELSQGMRGKLNVNKKFGQCSVWVVELGCKGIMKQGKPQVICID
jgi:hypothetical protein